MSYPAMHDVFDVFDIVARFHHKPQMAQKNLKLPHKVQLNQGKQPTETPGRLGR